MKLKSIFCGVAAAALLSACSSDEPAVNNGGGVAPKATGYMSVAVNLPTQPAGSRADSNSNNDNFDDGTSDEYAVKTAMLLLFTGTSEQDAKFHSAYDLNLTDPVYGGGNQGATPGQPDGNITSSYRKTIEVKGVQDNANLFGLVLVNYDGLVTKKKDEGGYLTAVSFGDGKNLTYPKAAAEGTPAVEGTSFSTLLGWTTDYAFHTTDNGFFMANAPVSTKQGGFVDPAEGGADVQTLVYIGVAENVLRPTEAEANESPAASFFVERAVAKVTLSHTVTTGPNKLVVDNVRWAIDNTEPSSYIVRNVESTDYVLNTYMGYKSNVPTVVNGYRFAGHTPIGQTSIQPFTQLFRTYWAVDPNGTLKTVYKKPVSGVLQPADAVNFGEEKAGDKLLPQYCHENTFSVANMTHENTTRVILEVKYKSTNADRDKDGSLYTVNGLLYDKLASAQSHGVKAMLPLIAQAIKKILPTDKAYKLEITTENISKYATINWVPTTDGKLIIGSVDFKDDPEGLEYNGATPFIEKREIDNVNADNAINNYKGGVSYYAVYIKHFGDDLTPWKGGAGNQLEIGTVYGTGETADQNYLGRYGMVRNNWYDLSISGFNKLGEPVVGNLTLDNTPDDVNEVQKFLSFRINILAWAKRVQNIEL